MEHKAERVLARMHSPCRMDRNALMGSAIDFQYARRNGGGQNRKGQDGHRRPSCPLRERGATGFRIQTSQVVEKSLAIV
jgi:hypothetical protein